MARYYCTCKKGAKTPHDYQHTTYNETEVDKEGICIYCGYYAFSRADLKHELFPRHKSKITDMDVYKTITSWKNNTHYHQYFHGCDKPTSGLARETLLKDQKRIRDAKEQKLKRANGNRG
mgnify:CR=1 FL=1